jgi:hypothetical protein
MLRLIDIAKKEDYDEFKVEINSKLEVIFDSKIYHLTDDDIIDLSEVNSDSKETTAKPVVNAPPFENQISKEDDFDTNS